MDVTARFSGAVVSFVLVSVILLQTSVTLGLVVLIGVPAADAADRTDPQPAAAPLGPPASADGRPGQHRDRHRQRAAGAARHRRRAGLPRPLPPRVAERTRAPGVEVARLQSVLDALQVFLPGLFVVIVVWLGGRAAASGSITAGRAGRVLRLLGVPADPAAHRHRVRRQADPRPGVGAPHLHRARGPARLRRAGGPGALPARGRRPRRRPHRPPDRAGPGDRDRLRAAGRGDRARRPARHVRRRGRRRRHARRRPAAGPAARGGTPPRGRLRHRGHAVRRSARASGSTSAATATSPARSTPPAPTTSSRRCPTASTPSSPSAAAASPAASGSGSCSPARCWPTPRSWCWSSRPPRSTPTPRPGSPRGCATTAPAGPPS